LNIFTFLQRIKSLLADLPRRASFLLSECASRGAFLLYRTLSIKQKKTPWNGPKRLCLCHVVYSYKMKCQVIDAKRLLELLEISEYGVDEIFNLIININKMR